MTRPIRVGDLVYVKSPNRCCGAHVGKTFRVLDIKNNNSSRWLCRVCSAGGELSAGGIICAFGFDNDPSLSMPLGRLKRIPPLDELEGVRTEATMKEYL